MRIWEKLKTDDLLRHSALIFASMLAVHASNVIFQMVVGRVLPKEEYALLAAFLGALAIIQRPLMTLRTALCHYGSLLEQEGRRGDIKRLLRKWLGLTALPSIVAGILAIVFSSSLSGFFVTFGHAVPYFLVRSGHTGFRHGPDVECRRSQHHLLADLPTGGALALCVVSHALL